MMNTVLAVISTLLAVINTLLVMLSTFCATVGIIIEEIVVIAKENIVLMRLTVMMVQSSIVIMVVTVLELAAGIRTGMRILTGIPIVLMPIGTVEMRIEMEEMVTVGTITILALREVGVIQGVVIGILIPGVAIGMTVIMTGMVISGIMTDYQTIIVTLTDMGTLMIGKVLLLVELRPNGRTERAEMARELTGSTGTEIMTEAVGMTGIMIEIMTEVIGIITREIMTGTITVTEIMIGVLAIITVIVIIILMVIVITNMVTIMLGVIVTALTGPQTGTVATITVMIIIIEIIVIATSMTATVVGGRKGTSTITGIIAIRLLMKVTAGTGTIMMKEDIQKRVVCTRKRAKGTILASMVEMRMVKILLEMRMVKILLEMRMAKILMVERARGMAMGVERIETERIDMAIRVVIIRKMNTITGTGKEVTVSRGATTTCIHGHDMIVVALEERMGGTEIPMEKMEGMGKMVMGKTLMERMEVMEKIPIMEIVVIRAIAKEVAKTEIEKGVAVLITATGNTQMEVTVDGRTVTITSFLFRRRWKIMDTPSTREIAQIPLISRITARITTTTMRITLTTTTIRIAITTANCPRMGIEGVQRWVHSPDPCPCQVPLNRCLWNQWRETITVILIMVLVVVIMVIITLPMVPVVIIVAVTPRSRAWKPKLVHRLRCNLSPRTDPSLVIFLPMRNLAQP